MQAEPILVLRGVRKRFGGLVATDDVSLEVRQGQVHALIGPNGAGKTTLASQITGDLQSDAGQVLVQGRDVSGLGVAGRARHGVSRSYQIVSVFGELSALENVMLAVQARGGRSFRFWTRVDADRDLRSRAQALLEQVGLEARAGVRAATLAHGEQRQLELAMTLAGEPRLLVLDEPLAGMGPTECDRIVALLASLRAGYAILLIEHDMDAVFALADTISVLVYGKVVATGSADQIRANATVREAYLGEGEHAC